MAACTALLAYRLPGGGNDAHHPTVFCYTNIGPRSPAPTGNEREGEREREKERDLISSTIGRPGVLPPPHGPENPPPPKDSTSSTFLLLCLCSYASSFVVCLFLLMNISSLSSSLAPASSYLGCGYTGSVFTRDASLLGRVNGKLELREFVLFFIFLTLDSFNCGNFYCMERSLLMLLCSREVSLCSTLVSYLFCFRLRQTLLQFISLTRSFHCAICSTYKYTNVNRYHINRIFN